MPAPCTFLSRPHSTFAYLHGLPEAPCHELWHWVHQTQHHLLQTAAQFALQVRYQVLERDRGVGVCNKTASVDTRTHCALTTAATPLRAYLAVHGLELRLELLPLVGATGREADDDGPLVRAQPLHRFAKVRASLLFVEVRVGHNGTMSKLQREGSK